ncbi:hypothetical protein [Zavarzinia sp. CC-PAN008]
MSRFVVVLAALAALAVVAGIIILATFDLPAPHQRVEQVVPNEQFEQ